VPVTGTASATCRVSYVVTDSWSGGFAASVTVQNSGSAVNGWSLGWSFPGGQVVQGHWHGQFQQTGAKVTVTNAAHNALIPAGGSINLGFTASGSPATPTPFTLNGAACS
jgi:cellulase/cellobiase CelA1